MTIPKTHSRLMKLFLLIVILTVPLQAVASDFEARVTRVVDGDTFDFEADILNVVVKGTCRMLHYDAPESYVMEGGQWRETDDPDAQEATERLTTLLGKESVLIKAERTDKYGRWLCEVWNAHGTSVNDVMKTIVEKRPTGGMTLEKLRELRGRHQKAPGN